MGQLDMAVRHVTQHHPEQLVAGLFAPHLRVDVGRWLETQVTTVERRLDKALELRVDGEPRLLSVEFLAELRDEDAYRIFEYTALLLMGLRRITDSAPLPPLESAVIVLGGRQQPWPPTGAYRTGWPESPFSGVHFRVEAVYQRTVAELLSRAGTLWLVFTPLAVDANVEAMRQVTAAIREREPDELERAELYAAMLVLAEFDPWNHNLHKEVRGMIAEQLDMDVIMKSATLREAFERGCEEGKEKGVEKGIERLLRTLFERRVGRALTTPEQQALAVQARTQTGQAALDAALQFEGEALAAWLLALPTGG